MPVIHVQALPQDPSVKISTVLTSLCSGVAEVFGLQRRQVYATWHTLQAGHFSEGDVPMEGQPHATHPPIVEFLAFEGRSPELVERALRCLTEILCKELKLAPGNAFIHYRELKSGQVCLAGNIKYRSPQY